MALIADMDETTLVSIIMPLFNKGTYVERAINSIKKQTYANWELIVVDDGSTDGSTEKVPQNDDRIQLISQDNAGPSKARNTGIFASKGDIIMFIDADDYYYPEKLSTTVSIFSEIENIDWMVAGFERSVDGMITREAIKYSNGDCVLEPVVIEDPLRDLCVLGWNSNGLCIKRRMLMETGGFDENMRCFEISEFVIRCALMKSLLYVFPNPLNVVEDVPNSAFKENQLRILGLRQLGERQIQLARNYPGQSIFLMDQAGKNIISYVYELIQAHNRKQALDYLLFKYPLARDIIWIKLCLRCLFLLFRS